MYECLQKGVSNMQQTPTDLFFFLVVAVDVNDYRGDVWICLVWGILLILIVLIFRVVVHKNKWCFFKIMVNHLKEQQSVTHLLCRADVTWDLLPWSSHQTLVWSLNPTIFNLLLLWWQHWGYCDPGWSVYQPHGFCGKLFFSLQTMFWRQEMNLLLALMAWTRLISFSLHGEIIY